MVSIPPSPRLGIDLRVLQQLRVGSSISRVELARQLSVAPSTVGTHVDHLVRVGLLRERKGESVSAGRPPTIVELNPEAGQFIGIDLDARQMYGASVDFSQRLLRDRTEMIAARETAEEVVERIGDVIEDVRDQSRELLGIGIAVPGTVDVSSGRVVHYRHIRGWQDFPLAEEVSSRFDVPVCIENNVRTMAHAEHCFGQAKALQHFVCLGIRSGIGAGIFIDGEIYRGIDGLAGEIGIWPSGCGKDNQTLEEIASLRAITERLSQAVRSGKAKNLKRTRNRVTMEGVIAAVQAGDPVVLKVLRESAQAIGRAITQVSLVVNPELVILCGPLAVLDDAFIAPVQEMVNDLIRPHRREVPSIVASKLGPLAGALGAATLAIEGWKPRDIRSESKNR